VAAEAPCNAFPPPRAPATDCHRAMDTAIPIVARASVAPRSAADLRRRTPRRTHVCPPGPSPSDRVQHTLSWPPARRAVPPRRIARRRWPRGGAPWGTVDVPDAPACGVQSGARLGCGSRAQVVSQQQQGRATCPRRATRPRCHHRRRSGAPIRRRGARSRPAARWRLRRAPTRLPSAARARDTPTAHWTVATAATTTEPPVPASPAASVACDSAGVRGPDRGAVGDAAGAGGARRGSAPGAVEGPRAARRGGVGARPCRGPGRDAVDPPPPAATGGPA
jgi:hypothetical protein